MGTNYYLAQKECAYCGHKDARMLHIGKSSQGWQFTFRGYRNAWVSWADEPLNITTFAEWIGFIQRELTLKPGRYIADEYGDEHPFCDLLQMIKDKRDGRTGSDADDTWHDENGNRFVDAEFR